MDNERMEELEKIEAYPRMDQPAAASHPSSQRIDR